MDKLPEGWIETSIENLCRLVTDGAHKTPRYTEDGVPFLSVKNITKGFIDFSDTRFISKEEHFELIRRCKPEKNDILYTKVGTTGIAKLIDTEKDFSLFVSLALLKPDSTKINSVFFEYQLNSPHVYSQAQRKTRGVANRNLVIRDIKSLCLQVPPLPEQKRIVSNLNALFERIDQSIALLEENIKHTEALMASALDEVFGEIDQEKFLPLLEICSPSKETLIPIDNEEYNYVGLENIQSNTGRIINFSRTEGKNIKSTKVRFKRGAVLYGKLRPYLNKVYVADFDGIATTEIMPFQTRKDLLNASFLAYFLRSPRFVALVNQYTSGARMPRATTTFFKKVAKVPVIPLNSQEKIVKKLDSYSKSIEGLLQEQKSKLNHLKSLKESILDKAFKGEL
ncbi:restriction endonuclease subunit S [Marinilabilia salmonicolor]|uniref:restriction endonuclease subunit S n=1 Tax=Marinilabilia salmonicolor TaxID=989 RepID=UPI00029A12D5|nr:restriction endonuclease subunit S [Marinilabilia salmonicolor]